MVLKNTKRKIKEAEELLKQLNESDIFDDPFLVDPAENNLGLPDQFDNTLSNNPHLRQPPVGTGKRKFIDKDRLMAEDSLDEVEATFPLVNFGNSETMKGQGFMGREFQGLDVDDPDPLGLEEEINMDNKNNIIKALNVLPFKDEILKRGGNIYAVGGVVRDAVMGKASSDLDIVITKVPKEDLMQILSRYGKADFTGTEFGVIKFHPNNEIKNQIMSLGFEDIIDVALPRADKAGDGAGHKDIEATVDHNMPIEKDLYRRDFTINSMALDIKGNLVDPFNGMDDIKSGVIKWTNPEAFIDDPLRTVRAIRFAAVYGYQLDGETKKAIIENKDKLNNLPSERFYMEFKKMEKKGGKQIFFNALKLLLETGLFKTIFKVDFRGDAYAAGEAKLLPEFFWLITKDSTDKPGVLFIETLKGTIDEKKMIDAFNLTKFLPEDVDKKRWVVFKMFRTSPESINSELMMRTIGEQIKELTSGKYPISFKELAINGNDLMNLGLKGKQVGDTLMNLLDLIYKDKLPNDKNQILGYLSKGDTDEISELMQNIGKKKVLDELRDDAGLNQYELAFKNITKDDIVLTDQKNFGDNDFRSNLHVTYDVSFKDPKLNKIYKKYVEDNFTEVHPVIDIELDHNNRIHFSGIPDNLQELGLARKCYEAAAVKLDYISSYPGFVSRSDSADHLWSSIRNRTDLYWFSVPDRIDLLIGDLDEASVMVIGCLLNYGFTFDQRDKYDTNIDDHYLSELEDSYSYLWDEED